MTCKMIIIVLIFVRLGKFSGVLKSFFLGFKDKKKFSLGKVKMFLMFCKFSIFRIFKIQYFYMIILKVFLSSPFAFSISYVVLDGLTPNLLNFCIFVLTMTTSLV